MNTQTKIAFINNAKRFAKKTFYKTLGKLVEITVLFGVGYALGLKLVRY